MTFFKGWDFTGSFTLVDLVAASTNALNGALLARRPDHFKNFTIVGILGMALLGGLGGGIARDVLLGDVPSALTNPAYITLALAFGTLGYSLAYAKGQLFREGLFQFMTSFSLPWYAIVGAAEGRRSRDPGARLPPAGRRWADRGTVVHRRLQRRDAEALPARRVVRDDRRPHRPGLDPRCRPMLGRKLKGKSQRELRDLGLLVEDGDSQVVIRAEKGAPAHG